MLPARAKFSDRTVSRGAKVGEMAWSTKAEMEAPKRPLRPDFR